MTSLRIRDVVAASIVVLTATVAAGCGSSGTSGGGSGLSADLFKTKADAICLAAKTERDAIVKPAGPAEAADYLEKGLANTNDEITKLTALRPPAAQTADWDATLALLKDRNTLIQATVDKIKGGADAQQTITADSAAIDAANTQAKAKAGSFGFAVCGKSG